MTESYWKATKSLLAHIWLSCWRYGGPIGWAVVSLDKRMKEREDGMINVNSPSQLLEKIREWNSVLSACYDKENASYSPDHVSHVQSEMLELINAVDRRQEQIAEAQADTFAWAKMNGYSYSLMKNEYYKNGMTYSWDDIRAARKKKYDEENKKQDEISS
jgi:hypothetical protein